MEDDPETRISSRIERMILAFTGLFIDEKQRSRLTEFSDENPHALPASFATGVLFGALLVCSAVAWFRTFVLP